MTDTPYKHFVAASKKVLEHKEQSCNHANFDPFLYNAILNEVTGHDRTSHTDMKRIEMFHANLVAAADTLAVMMGLDVTCLADLSDKLDEMTVEKLNSLVERS